MKRIATAAEIAYYCPNSQQNCWAALETMDKKVDKATKSPRDDTAGAVEETVNQVSNGLQAMLQRAPSVA